MYKHLVIFKAALLDIRNEWSWYLILMIVNPLSILFFLRIIIGDAIDFEAYVTGSIVMTFGTGVFLSLGQTFSFYKATASLDYYLSLPLSKVEIILSLVFRNIILSLPSMLVMLAIGAYFYDAKVAIGFPFVLAVLLTSLSLAGLGTMIGVSSKNMQTASILTQILTPIFTYLAPVFIPQSTLPPILAYVSYFLPTTYAANALRAAMQSNACSFDMVILAVIGLVCMFIVARLFDWRNE